MFSYITDLDTVEEIDEPLTVEVSGHDMMVSQTVNPPRPFPLQSLSSHTLAGRSSQKPPHSHKTKTGLPLTTAKVRSRTLALIMDEFGGMGGGGGGRACFTLSWMSSGWVGVGVGATEPALRPHG